MSSKSRIPGPGNILLKTLPNGIRVYIMENDTAQSVTFSTINPCGNYLDPAELRGLAYFTANLMNTGTKKHDFTEINTLLEENGASLSFSTGNHTMGVNGKCLAEDLPMLLDLLMEDLTEAVFPEDHLEILRRQLLTSYELRMHDPESVADMVFDREMFGDDHPYGAVSGGIPETVSRIRREHLIDFRNRYVSPRGMCFCIAGGINAEKTLQLLGEKFGSWQKTAEAVNEDDFFPPVSPLAEGRRVHSEIPDKPEMNLVVGSIGPVRAGEDYFPALLGNCILGEFGMMGRIGQVVRDDHGLAYYAGSSLTALSRSGAWTVEAGVNADNVETALDLIRNELIRFTSEEVTEEELSDVKSYFTGSLPLTFEGNGGLVGAMKTIESYGLPLDYYERSPERINAVTAEDILRTARKYIDPDKMLTVTAGTKR